MNILSKMTRRAFSAMAGGALLFAAGASYADPIVLRYSDFGPPRGPRAEAMEWWASELASRTNGEITVEFFWSQALAKGKDTMKAVGSGLADAGSVLGIYTPAELPLWNLANAPYGVDDVWVGMRAWLEMRNAAPALREETDKRNIHIFANYTSGGVHLISKDPITSAADLKGLKIRTSGGWTGLLELLGATPVKIGVGEVYQALDRGTIDASIFYVPTAKAYKLYEVANNMTLVNMGQVLGYGGGINLDIYNQMTDEQREIFDQLGVELVDRIAMNYVNGEAAAKAALEAGIDGKAIAFHEASDIKAWRAAAAPYTANWIEKMNAAGVDADAYVTTLEATIAKFEAELRDKGYPWTR